MISYVVGFMFSNDLKSVVLIRKNKPAWQSGLLNGVGGKVEEYEEPLDAMARSFEEEAGPTCLIWSHYCRMSGTNNDGSLFEVNCYYAVGDLTEVSTREAEVVSIYEVNQIISRKEETIDNIPWLVMLAQDCADGTNPPSFVTVNY